jgi:hypothetical protein
VEGVELATSGAKRVKRRMRNPLGHRDVDVTATPYSFSPTLCLARLLLSRIGPVCNRITPHPPIRTEIRCPLYIKSALVPPLRRGPFPHQINAKSRYIRRRINCRLGAGAGIIMRISVYGKGSSTTPRPSATAQRELLDSVDFFKK